MVEKLAAWGLGLVVVAGACAEGSTLPAGSAWVVGTGGSITQASTSTGGASSASTAASSSSSDGTTSSSTGSSSSTGGGGASSSSATSSSSSASTSVSSGSGGIGGNCPGTVVDWNWNAGTAPVSTLTYSGPHDWAVGVATNGPSDGMTYLATAPGSNYPNNANDWVQLPMIDLSAYQSCQLRVTVQLWRDTEQFAGEDYDGGNLQFTSAAAGNSGWAVLNGPMMAYDGELPTCTASCLVSGQSTWASSEAPEAKAAVYTSPTPPGDALWLRFTFSSDSSNAYGPLPGIFVASLLVEAY